MIIESILGGAVIVLATAGMCSVYRYIRQKTACWFNAPQPEIPQQETTLKDPTPSFTVELVRTVLEHQARREDQSRHQLTLLLMQIANAKQCDGCASIPFIDVQHKPLSQHTRDVFANARDGMVARTVRRLLPIARR
jgi:hypothetical protein